MLFSNPNEALGWIALPNILTFQYIIPSIIPLADIIAHIGIRYEMVPIKNIT
jgi:hypothetical protein